MDAGLIQLHVRAPARTRIEGTEQIFHGGRGQDPATRFRESDLGLVLDNIGLPQRDVQSGLHRWHHDRCQRRPASRSQLNEGHAPTADYVKQLRRELPVAFPDVAFYFQPADMVTQMLNFGVPSQIDVQVQGRDRADNQVIAQELQQRMAAIPGIVDAHMQQELDAPELDYTIDRTRAQELGLNVSTIANDLNISLSSSEQVSPNFWTDPKNGIPYLFRGADAGIPCRAASRTSTIRRSPAPESGDDVVPNTAGQRRARRSGCRCSRCYNHANIQPVYDIYASVQDRDLGSARRGDPARWCRRRKAKLGPRQSHRRPRSDRQHGSCLHAI